MRRQRFVIVWDKKYYAFTPAEFLTKDNIIVILELFGIKRNDYNIIEGSGDVKHFIDDYWEAQVCR